jgi:enolase
VFLILFFNVRPFYLLNNSVVSLPLDQQYDGNVISGEQLGELYQSLAADFPIVTIEDPFDEDDWANWSKYVHVYHYFVILFSW